MQERIGNLVLERINDIYRRWSMGCDRFRIFNVVQYLVIVFDQAKATGPLPQAVRE
jgi:hypothetical protein